MNDSIFFRFFLHQGTFQNFQEAQLQLVRFHLVHVIERMLKCIIILVRKTRDQVQMLMNISEAVHTVNTPFQLVKIHMTMNRTNRLRIC